MAEEERMAGPLGIWKFPLMSRGLAKEKEKVGEEGFLGRMSEKAPGIIIQHASTAAGKIAGQTAKEAVSEGLVGVLGRVRGGLGLL